MAGGWGAGSGITRERRGRNEMSWLLPPARFPSGSPSVAAKGPPLQDGGGEGRGRYAGPPIA